VGPLTGGHGFKSLRSVALRMPKYSTGSSGGGGGGDACELCGRETGDLGRANVAGAELLVCADCRPHGEGEHGTGGGGPEAGTDGTDADTDRTREAVRRQARMYDAATGDSTRWEEEGTDYESDRLPYLVADYGPAVEAARQDAGLTVEELAAEIDADTDDLLAIEQGRATRAGVGGSVVRRIEERLDVEIVDADA